MTDRQAVIAPPREDASHCPPLAIRPLTLRAWPSHPTPILTDILADALAAEDMLLLETPAPADDVATRPAPRRSIAPAAYGIAASLLLAVVYLIAR